LSTVSVIPQHCYFIVLLVFLPPALLGWTGAAFLAAYMSTVGTQLNWGTSYLVNDFYRRFLKRRASERHYVIISKLFTIGLVILTGYVAAQLTSILQGWQIVLAIGSGTGAVYILRWYWWRVNAWSEIVAMGVSGVIALSLAKVSFAGSEPVVFAKTALITAGCTSIAWVLATVLTPAEPDAKLLSFYRPV